MKRHMGIAPRMRYLVVGRSFIMEILIQYLSFKLQNFEAIPKIKMPKKSGFSGRFNRSFSFSL